MENTSGPLGEAGARLRALVAQWREHCDAVRRELGPGGVREYQQEGPRYGIAAVEQCADELDAMLSAPVVSPQDEWRCFHCDEVFTTPGSARDHFGAAEGADPGCLVDRVALEEGGKPERGRGLLMALRKAEDEIAKLRREAEELENDSRLWHESETDRIRRIGRCEWWQELDSREGERLVLVERAEKAEAALAQFAAPVVTQEGE